MGFEARFEPLRLLDLVCAVQDAASNDREVVAALQHLLEHRELRPRLRDVSREHGEELAIATAAFRPPAKD